MNVKAAGLFATERVRVHKFGIQRFKIENKVSILAEESWDSMSWPCTGWFPRLFKVSQSFLWRLVCEINSKHYKTRVTVVQTQNPMGWLWAGSKLLSGYRPSLKWFPCVRGQKCSSEGFDYITGFRRRQSGPLMICCSGDGRKRGAENTHAYPTPRGQTHQVNTEVHVSGPPGSRSPPALVDPLECNWNKKW